MGLSRRSLLRLLAAGTGSGLAIENSSDRGGVPVPAVGGDGGGGGGEDSGRVFGSSESDAYRVDVASGLGAVEDVDKPQFIFITSGSDKGEYVNVSDDAVPLVLTLGGFELAVADTLGSVPDRNAPLQVIFIRSGADKGVHINVESEPYESEDEAIEVAVANALGDISEPDQFPDLNWITESGSVKGAHVNTQ